MSVNKAISNILDKNLDEMRVNFSSALSEKAVMKLDEKKAKIGKGYFGQVMEDETPADQGRKAAKKDDDLRDRHMKKFGKVPARLTGALSDKFVKRQAKKMVKE